MDVRSWYSIGEEIDGPSPMRVVRNLVGRYGSDPPPERLRVACGGCGELGPIVKPGNLKV